MRKDNAKEIKKALHKTGVRPSKTKGQNFLIDQNFIQEIFSFGNAELEKKIVEIGPGLGALTKELSKAQDLTLIELESEFCEELKIKYPHTKIINNDVRNVDFSLIGRDLLVFGNLPYVYSTEIVFHLIENRNSIERAVLLLQQEFSERMAAGPGSKAFGVLSIALQVWAELRLGPIIKGDAFVPPTKVNSRLVELKFQKEPRYPIKDLVLFKRLVRAAFHQRRKMIGNSISAAGLLSKEKAEVLLRKSGIDSKRRAETLEISEYVKLCDELLKMQEP